MNATKVGGILAMIQKEQNLYCNLKINRILLKVNRSQKLKLINLGEAVFIL